MTAKYSYKTKHLCYIQKAADNQIFCPPFLMTVLKDCHECGGAFAEGRCQTLTLYAHFVYYLAGSSDPALVGLLQPTATSKQGLCTRVSN